MYTVHRSNEPIESALSSLMDAASMGHCVIAERWFLDQRWMDALCDPGHLRSTKW